LSIGGKDVGIARTETGNFAIVPLRNEIHRVAAMEWQQPPEDHREPSLDELREAIKRVIAVDLPMSAPV
jgi:hypothetical protein